jgi:transketolase
MATILDEVGHTLEEVKSIVGKGKPIAIIRRTIMEKGAELMENDHNWYVVAPNNEKLKKHWSN